LERKAILKKSMVEKAFTFVSLSHQKK